MEQFGRARGAQDSEFTTSPEKDPDQGDPIEPGSQKWVHVVSGRLERQRRTNG